MIGVKHFSATSAKKRRVHLQIWDSKQTNKYRQTRVTIKTLL